MPKVGSVPLFEAMNQGQLLGGNVQPADMTMNFPRADRSGQAQLEREQANVLNTLVSGAQRILGHVYDVKVENEFYGARMMMNAQMNDLRENLAKTNFSNWEEEMAKAYEGVYEAAASGITTKRAERRFSQHFQQSWEEMRGRYTIAAAEAQVNEQLDISMKHIDQHVQNGDMASALEIAQNPLIMQMLSDAQRVELTRGIRREAPINGAVNELKTTLYGEGHAQALTKFEQLMAPDENGEFRFSNYQMTKIQEQWSETRQQYETVKDNESRRVGAERDSGLQEKWDTGALVEKDILDAGFLEMEAYGQPAKDYLINKHREWMDRLANLRNNRLGAMQSFAENYYERLYNEAVRNNIRGDDARTQLANAAASTFIDAETGAITDDPEAGPSIISFVDPKRVGTVESQIYSRMDDTDSPARTDYIETRDMISETFQSYLEDEKLDPDERNLLADMSVATMQSFENEIQAIFSTNEDPAIRRSKVLEVTANIRADLADFDLQRLETGLADAQRAARQFVDGGLIQGKMDKFIEDQRKVQSGDYRGTAVLNPRTAAERIEFHSTSLEYQYGIDGDIQQREDGQILFKIPADNDYGIQIPSRYRLDPRNPHANVMYKLDGSGRFSLFVVEAVPIGNTGEFRYRDVPVANTSMAEAFSERASIQRGPNNPSARLERAEAIEQEVQQDFADMWTPAQ